LNNIKNMKRSVPRIKEEYKLPRNMSTNIYPLSSMSSANNKKYVFCLKIFL